MLLSAPRAVGCSFLAYTAVPTFVTLSVRQFNVGDLVTFYKEAKKRFDEDEGFKEIARAEVGVCVCGVPK